jgi:multimeric flavodoxin WrbA
LKTYALQLSHTGPTHDIVLLAPTMSAMKMYNYIQTKAKAKGKATDQIIECSPCYIIHSIDWIRLFDLCLDFDYIIILWPIYASNVSDFCA